MPPTFFAKQSDLRKWFKKNHDKETELVIGFYKVGSDKPCLTWSQSVDEALCFGWIDGIRKSIDSKSYCIRFTPRKQKSIWSAVNIKKVEKLTEKGLMYPAGLASFEKRDERKSKIYSYEQAPQKFSGNIEKKFKANQKAWTFFQSQAPSYQKMATHWVMTSKQAKTKFSRLEKLIASSEAGRRV